MWRIASEGYLVQYPRASQTSVSLNSNYNYCCCFLFVFLFCCFEIGSYPLTQVAESHYVANKGPKLITILTLLFNLLQRYHYYVEQWL